MAALLGVICCLASFPAPVSAGLEDLGPCSSASGGTQLPDGSIVALGSSGGCEGSTGFDPLRPQVLVGLDSTGRLNSAFGDGGIKQLLFAARDSEEELLQSMPGKLLLVGPTSMRSMNPDGSVDNGYGDNGSVEPGSSALLNAGLIAAAVAQPGGKVVVALAAGSGNNVLGRFNADGTLDPTFGTGGQTSIPVVVHSLAVDAEGRIIAANAARIMRLSADGEPDLDFGSRGDGMVFYGDSAQDNPMAGFEMRDLVIQPDDSIHVLGEANPNVYSYYGIRYAVDVNGVPIPGSSPGIISSAEGHAGHAFSQLPDGGLAYSLAPNRGGEAGFAFSALGWSSNRFDRPTPGGAVVNGFIPLSDGSFLAAGVGEIENCADACPKGSRMVFEKVNSLTGELKPDFGGGGVVLVPGSRCQSGSEGKNGGWDRCRVKPPVIAGRVFFKQGSSRQPALLVNLNLGPPPSTIWNTTQTVTLTVPASLKLRKGGLKRRVWFKGAAQEGFIRRLRVSGRRVSASFKPGYGSWYPELGEIPAPTDPAPWLQVGIKSGTLKPIGRQARRKLKIPVRATFTPDPEGIESPYAGDWFAPGSSRLRLGVRPVRGMGD